MGIAICSDGKQIRRHLQRIEGMSARFFFFSVYLTSRLVAETRGVNLLEVEFTIFTHESTYQIQRKE